MTMPDLTVVPDCYFAVQKRRDKPSEENQLLDVINTSTNTIYNTKRHNRKRNDIMSSFNISMYVIEVL